jgi:type I restriction enzyme S subunit
MESSIDRGNGATVDTLTIQKLQSVTLELPSLSEQHRIVAKLDELADSTQRLGELYGRKLTALDELKKSLLREALTGQLAAKATDQQVAEVA